VADESLAQKLLDLVQQASHYRQIKRGANEAESISGMLKPVTDSGPATKTLNGGVAELIILSADVTPLAILLHLPFALRGRERTLYLCSQPIGFGTGFWCRASGDCREHHDE